MPFNPKVNDQLKIGPETYTITEHPAAKGMPYGQAGRRATVYQLATIRKEFRALKVFNAVYRTDDTRIQAEKLSKYAILPGMIACKRIVLSPILYPDLRNRLKSLQYSVIMPWVEGTTWQELIMAKEILNKGQCIALADGFLQTMVNMERKGIAHCDLSGPNLIIDLVGLRKHNLANGRFQSSLIDLEEIYAPGFSQPKKLPAGSAGYAHKTVKNGIWSVDADRFAGAILLANILTWHYQPMHEESFGEQFFDPDEIHSNCKRQALMAHALKSQYGLAMETLFNRAWYSETLQECPTFSEWANTLNIEVEEISDVPIMHKDIATTPLPQSMIPKPNVPRPVGGPVTGWVSLVPKQDIASIPAPQTAKPSSRPNQDNFWEWDTPEFDPKRQKTYSIDYSPSTPAPKKQTAQSVPPVPPPLFTQTGQAAPPMRPGGYIYPPQISHQNPTTPSTNPTSPPQQREGMTDGQVAAVVFIFIVLLMLLIAFFATKGFRFN